MSSSVRPRDRRLRTRSLIVLGGLTVAVAALALPASAASHAASASFTADQERLLDTRLSPSPGPITGFTQFTVSDATPTGSTVELSVTAVTPVGYGHLTVYPDNLTVPGTANVNYYPGVTTASTVLELVPASGVIDLNVSGGATNVVVDEDGYFSADTLVGTTPIRLGDSRLANDGFATVGAQSGTVSLAIPTASVPADSGLLAVSVAVVPSANGSGYVNVYGATKPATSSVNFAAGRVASNLVFVQPVKTASGYAINFTITGSSTALVVDLEAAAPSGSTFTAPTLFRAADSRTGLGLTKGPLTGLVTLTLPAADAPAGSAVALSVASTGSTTGGYEVAFPAGAVKPAIANLSFAKGATIAQTVVVPVNSSGQVSFYIYGSTQLVVDYQGVVAPSPAD